DRMSHDQIDDCRDAPVDGHRGIRATDREEPLERADQRLTNVVNVADDHVAGMRSEQPQQDGSDDDRHDNARDGAYESRNYHVIHLPSFGGATRAEREAFAVRAVANRGPRVRMAGLPPASRGDR